MDCANPQQHAADAHQSVQLVLRGVYSTHFLLTEHCDSKTRQYSVPSNFISPFASDT